jgi:endonuclease YncB( thermonuclease family)
MKFRGKWTKYSCRAYGWDAPEMKPQKAGRTEISLVKEKADAKAAKVWLETWWKEQKYVALIHFKGYDKYGRVLAEIPGLKEEFMKTGLIVPYDGKTKVQYDNRV